MSVNPTTVRGPPTSRPDCWPPTPRPWTNAWTRWPRAVCDNDPRTLDQRRSDALGAFGHGADRLACACDNPDCAAAGAQPSAVVVHVIAHEDSLTDDTPAQFDGEEPPAPTAANCER